jgi:hypothetical protein
LGCPLGGDCPIGAICNEDTDANCVVDVDDMINVLNGQGCPCGESFGPSTLPPLEDLIAAVLQSTLPAETQAEIIGILITMFG